MVNYHNKLAVKYRNLLEIAFFNKCWFCGKIKEYCGKLQFFHIKATKLNGRGRGFYARMLDIIKNPCSYGLACDECHNKFDSGFLMIEDILI